MSRTYSIPVKRASVSPRELFSLRRMLYLFYAVCLLWVAIAAQSVTDFVLSSPIHMPEYLTAAAELAMTESCLELTCRLPDTYISAEDRTGLLSYLAEGIGIQIHPQEAITHTTKQSYELYSFLHNGQYAQTILQAITLYDDATQNLLRIRITIFEDIARDVLHYHALLTELLTAVGVTQAETSLQYTGIQQGSLSYDAVRMLAEKQLASLDGSAACIYSEGNTYIAYGYCAKIPEYVLHDSARINLEIGFAYDEETDTTQIYLACPLQIKGDKTQR